MAEITREFDPRIPVPEGLEGAEVREVPIEEYQDEDNDGEGWVGNPYELFFSEDGSDVFGDFSEADLGVPDYMMVVGQSIRTGPDGKKVVDIVIEVEDVPGAENYEIRVSPA